MVGSWIGDRVKTTVSVKLLFPVQLNGELLQTQGNEGGGKFPDCFTNYNNYIQINIIIITKL